MPLLDEPDVQRFLAHSMVVQVATVSAKGTPFVTPLWSVSHGGRLYITTGRRARAPRNLAQRPHIVVLCTGEWLGASGRALRGRTGCSPSSARPLAYRLDVLRCARGSANRVAPRFQMALAGALLRAGRAGFH